MRRHTGSDGTAGENIELSNLTAKKQNERSMQIKHLPKRHADKPEGAPQRDGRGAKERERWKEDCETRGG